MRLIDLYPSVPSPSMHLEVAGEVEARQIASALRAVAADAPQYWAGSLRLYARLLEDGARLVRLDEGAMPYVARAMELVARSRAMRQVEESHD